MAETLFGDAELDLLTAAFASAAGWSDSEPPTEAAAPPEAKKAAAKPAAPPSDDLLDLLGLGPDAPLELIDDSQQPPTGAPRKTATQR